MKSIRFVILLSLLALLAMTAGGAFAQEETFGLSAADWQLFTTANANSGVAANIEYSFVMNLNVTGTDGGQLTANGSGVIGASETNPLFSLLVDASATGDEPMSGSFEIRLVGNMFFMNLLDSGWMGAPLEELLGEATEGLGAMGLPADPEDLASGDMSALMSDPAAMQVMQAVGQLGAIDPADLISITRLADEGGAAHFSASVDVGALLSSEAFASLMTMGMSAEDTGMTAEQMQMQTQMMTQMMSQLGQNTRLTFDQYIDTATNLVNRAVLNFSIDLSQLGMGGAVDLVFDINLAYPNSVTVEAPADFQPLDLNALMMGSM